MRPGGGGGGGRGGGGGGFGGSGGGGGRRGLSDLAQSGAHAAHLHRLQVLTCEHTHEPITPGVAGVADHVRVRKHMLELRGPSCKKARTASCASPCQSRARTRSPFASWGRTLARRRTSRSHGSGRASSESPRTERHRSCRISRSWCHRAARAIGRAVHTAAARTVRAVEPRVHAGWRSSGAHHSGRELLSAKFTRLARANLAVCLDVLGAAPL